MTYSDQTISEIIDALRRIAGSIHVTQMQGIEESMEFRLPAELRA